MDNVIKKNKIVRMFEESMNNFNVKQDLYFQEPYLADKLINILGTEENTE
ncbi:TPA: hypothetical protein OV624_001564 [Listeria monocytogenes]|nr:hypothetical protein [Listeria monocytogenes]HCV3198766.1 hypothetical protein [Listeria monocytogenes]